MATALRLLAAALLAGCAFDPSGMLGAGVDAAPAIDAMPTGTEGVDGGEPAGDGGADPDAGESIPPDAAPADAAIPPDAKPEEEEDCGGFGEACCAEGDACGALLLCVGGVCL